MQWSSDEDSVMPGGAGAEAGLLLRLRRSHLALLWGASLSATAVATRWAVAPRHHDVVAQNAVGEVVEEWAWGSQPSLWPDFFNFFEDAKYIDLTHAFEPDSPVWNGFGPSSFAAGRAGGDVAGKFVEGAEFTYETHGFITTQLDLSTDQLGTQLDPPAHWNEYGATIADLPATYSLRQLVVIDVSTIASEDLGYEVTRADIEHWEANYGTIPEGSVVFIRTDWSQHWEDYKGGNLPADFPGVGLEALKFLHEERHILFHGHEPLDTDQTPVLEGEAWLMHNHFAQVEGLKNLDQVQPHGCLVSMGWPKVRGGTGSFARFVAICPDAPNVGGVSLEARGEKLPEQEHPLRRDRRGVLVPTVAPDTEYCLGPVAYGCLDGVPTWEEADERVAGQ